MRPKEGIGYPKAEAIGVVSLQMWVLGTEPGFFAKVILAFHC